jgi:predicted nucleic acid-binding protein
VSPPVVDASILAKLVFHEPGSVEARAAVEDLAMHRAPIHVPDLVFAELASIGVKKHGREQASRQQARRLVDIAIRLPLAIWSSQLVAPAALEISLALGTSPYDSLYLAVAEQVDGALLTADRRLAERLRGTPLESRVEVLGGSW